MPGSDDPLAFGQLSILNLVTIITSLIASSAAIMVMVMATCIIRYRILWSRAMFLMALGNFNEAVAKMVGPFAVAAGSSSLLCQGQAGLLVAAQLASNIWAHYISMVFFLVLVRSWTVERAIKTMDRIYAVVGIVVPTLVALPWLWVRDDVRGPAYADMVTWCWVSRKYPMVQVLTAYAPMALISVFNVVVFSIVGLKIYRTQHRLGSASSASTSNRRLTGFVVGVSVYMLMFLVSWVPGVVYYVYREYLDGDENFTLLLLRVLSTPLRGLLALVLYWMLARSSMGRKGSEEPDALSTIASNMTLSIRSAKHDEPPHDTMSHSVAIASSPILGRFHDAPLAYTTMHGTPEYERRMGQELTRQPYEAEPQWQRKASTVSVDSSVNELSRLCPNLRRASTVSITTPTDDEADEPFAWLRRSSEEAIRQRAQEVRRKPSAHAILLERVKEEDA